MCVVSQIPLFLFGKNNIFVRFNCTKYDSFGILFLHLLLNLNNRIFIKLKSTNKLNKEMSIWHTCLHDANVQNDGKYRYFTTSCVHS